MPKSQRITESHVQWLTFKYMVVGFMLAKGYFKRVEDAADFADSLSMSYEQDYKPRPQVQWGAMIERDYNEMKASEEDHNENRH